MNHATNDNNVVNVKISVRGFRSTDIYLLKRVSNTSQHLCDTRCLNFIKYNSN